MRFALMMSSDVRRRLEGLGRWRLLPASAATAGSPPPPVTATTLAHPKDISPLTPKLGLKWAICRLRITQMADFLGNY